MPGDPGPRRKSTTPVRIATRTADPGHPAPSTRRPAPSTQHHPPPDLRRIWELNAYGAFNSHIRQFPGGSAEARSGRAPPQAGSAQDSDVLPAPREQLDDGGLRAGAVVVREVGVLRSPLTVLARVLDGDEGRAVLVADDRAAGLTVARDGEELLDAAAVLAVQGHPEQSVVVADAGGGAVGGDPEVAHRIEGQVVGAGDRGDLLHREAGEVRVAALRRVAADQQQVPRERGRGLVALLVDLDDVAVAVLGARVDLVGRGAAVHAAFGV